MKRPLRLFTPVLALLAAPLVAAEIHVSTTPLGDLLIAREQSAPATVESLNHAELSAEISARIETVTVRIGDAVSKGDELIRLDCRSHRSRLSAQQATLKQLQANQRLAVKQLERARNLKTGRSISEEEIDQRTADVSGLNAQIENQEQQVAQARLDVEHCGISAPFDCLITSKMASPGTLASPGTPLLGLVQLSDAEVSAQIRESQAKDLEQAQSVALQYGGQQYPLKLRALLPVIDPQGRTREARFRFEGGNAPVGAAGRLVWTQDAPLLPANLMVRRDDRMGVFVLEREKANFKAIDGALEGQPAPVNLPEGTLVITDGRQRLQHGDTVVVDPNPSIYPSSRD